jgi:hypothetical protein
MLENARKAFGKKSVSIMGELEAASKDKTLVTPGLDALMEVLNMKPAEFDEALGRAAVRKAVSAASAFVSVNTFGAKLKALKAIKLHPVVPAATKIKPELANGGKIDPSINAPVSPTGPNSVSGGISNHSYPGGATGLDILTSHVSTFLKDRGLNIGSGEDYALIPVVPFNSKGIALQAKIAKRSGVMLFVLKLKNTGFDATAAGDEYVDYSNTVIALIKGSEQEVKDHLGLYAAELGKTRNIFHGYTSPAKFMSGMSVASKANAPLNFATLTRNLNALLSAIAALEDAEASGDELPESNLRKHFTSKAVLPPVGGISNGLEAMMKPVIAELKKFLKSRKLAVSIDNQHGINYLVSDLPGGKWPAPTLNAISDFLRPKGAKFESANVVKGGKKVRQYRVVFA